MNRLRSSLCSIRGSIRPKRYTLTNGGGLGGGRCTPWDWWCARLLALAAREDDDRDLANGLRLVIVRHGVGSGEALVQGSALRLVGDDRDGLEGLAAHLDGR